MHIAHDDQRINQKTPPTKQKTRSAKWPATLVAHRPASIDIK